jgi:Bacterial Ig-like domain (group 1)
MKHRSPWLAGVAAVALALITTATAFAAGSGSEVAATVTIARLGGTVPCGVNITVTATVVDATGTPIPGQLVDWSFAPKPKAHAADTISPSTSPTDASGVATTTVVLACVPGDRHIRATAGAASGSAVLNVHATGAVLGVTSGAVLGVTSGGLPNTSTLPGKTPAPQDLPVIGMLLAILAMAAGGGLILRRVSLSRS